MDIGAWLRGLGLEQYEGLFRKNDIDADVLGDLTDVDFEKLGVTLGHRKRLLKAIACLGATDRAAKSARPAPSSSSTDAAERRPITVMFCDLVGSTSLASRLDAEDWRNLVGAYLDEASAAVTGLGGHVLKKLGDGLMALFGYPQAQENDAERAVRAALAIQRALAELNARNARSGAPELSARIGLECGSVVVDASGEVFGEAPNVAARVQAAAEPGTVLVTASVQRQTAGLFVAEDRGAHELKGVLEPVTLYRIVRASGAGRRSGARALTPLVGREEELDLLSRRWSRALEGEGQFVQIVGEPGIGKSRLVEEFRAKLAETPHTWVEWAASQLLQNTPLHPLAEWGRLRYGGADASDGQKLADLENTLRLIGLDAAEYAPLLAPLFDVALPENRAAKFAPEELRRRQLAAMTASFLAGARSQPIVLAFEDLHWADPTSLDLLRALVERGAQAPLLLLATTRPEFRPPWSLRSHHSLVSLAPLDRAGVARMVGEISANHTLSRELIEGVSERTGGVPLFVEEVTRLLLERGEQGGVQAIPPTLQQSLAARLDRLGPAREVAQIGAVLGREFSYALLRSVGEVADPALQSALDRLVEADLLLVEGAPPQATHRFKHALIQDAAYDSLLRSRRQALHRRAAELLRDDPERATAEPEVIAHHLTQAGLDDLAIEWWGKAGDQALRRSAFQEAIAHLGRAIEMVDKTGGVPRRAEDATPSSQRLKLQVHYGQAVMWSKGYAADETKAAFARAHELAPHSANNAERYAIYFARWVSSTVSGELNSARETAESFLREAEAAGGRLEATRARLNLGLTCLFQGELALARSHHERVLADDPEPEMDARRMFDARILATVYLAMSTWLLGDVRHSQFLIERAVPDALASDRVATIAQALTFKTMLDAHRDDPAATLRSAEALVEMARARNMEFYAALGELYSSWARGRLLDPKADATELRQALAAYLAQGNRAHGPRIYGLIAELEAMAGRAESALASVDAGLALAEETGERWTDPLLFVRKGEILLKRDPENTAPAEEAFETALAIAREQGARSWALRAALSLAKLYQSTDRPADAHAVLAPALEGFSPTSEMPEIAEAEALLATLADTEEALAQRERRLHLQTSYSQALMWSKGYAAEETKAAFARAVELASGAQNAVERYAAYRAQWTRCFTCGEFRLARRTAETFLREAEEDGCAMAVGVARRSLGLTCLVRGDLAEARTFLEQALASYAPDHDAQARFRFGFDTGVVAAGDLAFAIWHLGELERARQLAAQAVRSATELGHVATGAVAYGYVMALEVRRGDPAAALRLAEVVHALGREHGMDFFIALGEVVAGWARGRLHDPGAGGLELQKGLAAYVKQGNRLFTPWFHGLLAELEATTQGAAAALALIEQGLAISQETGECFSDPYLHRLRGFILLSRDPADPAAEEAFQTAIAIAKQQGARSYELLASLSLAKLYQSTGRPIVAHSVLAPALEGFAPTPEMPEIAEAHALMERLT